MSSACFEIAYDGDDLRGHAMDVQELAPALLALGNLVRDANAQINGDRSQVRVLVQSDFEHKCFNVSIEVVQSIISSIQTVLIDKTVRDAKDILEWVGLIGGGAATTATSVIGVLRWRGRNRQQGLTEVRDTSPGGDVVLRNSNGNSVTMHQNVYVLANDPQIQRAVAGVMAPLSAPGIETITLRDNDPKTEPINFDKTASAEIAKSLEPDESEALAAMATYEPQPVVAHLLVYSPVFSRDAKNWRFLYGENIITADISETSIAEDALRRGVASKDDLYRVRLSITEHETPSGQFRNSYKIMEVLDFRPARMPPVQPQLFDDAPR